MAHTWQAWAAEFPSLSAAPEAERQRIFSASNRLVLPAGQAVFRAGDACENYLMVLAGSVRVQKLAESGREIVLYRVERGQTCVITTSCLLAGERYPAEAVTESEVTAVALTRPRFQEALAESATFRTMVFAALGRRLSDLMILVEELAFGSVDRRLARALLELAAGSRVHATHEQLAAELGTAREVISRRLKGFERSGWIELRRGDIHILDAAALSDLRET